MLQNLYNHTIGQGPDLVLIHGWGMNSTVWEDVAIPLAQMFRVTLLDLPGHGHSPWLNHLTSLDDWVNACLEIVPPDAIWVGWSLGGTIAMQAALQAPKHIYALVLITTTPCFLRNEHWPHGLATNVLENFIDDLNTNWAETLRRFLTLQTLGSNNATPLLRSLRYRLAKQPSPNLQALTVGLNLLKTTDLSQRITHLRLPTMWLYGGRDTLVSKYNAEVTASLLPTAQIHIINDAAHAPFISHQQQSLEYLELFTTRIFTTTAHSTKEPAQHIS